jgi:hypothetical protein
MSKFWKLATVATVTALMGTNLVSAERLSGLGCACKPDCCEPNYCGSCDSCGGGWLDQGRHHGHHKYYEGRTAHFNCGCNGSYKYPVPPLSTYHWPGMWSHQLMTDYHSPWRFPPLKPYVDEPLPIEMGAGDGSLRRVQAVSHRADDPAPLAAEPFSFSSRVLRMSR